MVEQIKVIEIEIDPELPKKLSPYLRTKYSGFVEEVENALPIIDCSETHNPWTIWRFSKDWNWEYHTSFDYPYPNRYNWNRDFQKLLSDDTNISKIKSLVFDYDFAFDSSSTLGFDKITQGLNELGWINSKNHFIGIGSLFTTLYELTKQSQYDRADLCYWLCYQLYQKRVEYWKTQQDRLTFNLVTNDDGQIILNVRKKEIS